ncbi:MAG: DNA topoisomerase VI subunit B, partial [Bdellovibrionota bacterium]
KAAKTKEQPPEKKVPAKAEEAVEETEKESAPRTPRATAESMAAKQREISVSEFFTKNRHLLGFDNPAKALLTTVKEAVDNSLDACEEAGILPTISITISTVNENRYRVCIEDNGPGIVKEQAPKIFGKLLYGSKFHRLKQSRGQQGIGISAAGMYGYLTTGKPVHVISRTGKGKNAWGFDIQINTRTNSPEVLREETVDFPLDHGTRVQIELEASYKRGKRSVDDYVQQTAVANPHTEFHYKAPDGQEFHYPRAAKELPLEAKEIKPHPHGVELGMLIQIAQDTKARNVKGMLQSDFSRVSGQSAQAMLEKAGIDPDKKSKDLAAAEIEKLHQVIGATPLLAPPTNCLSPIGEELLRKSLEARYKADVVIARTRKPAVYRGNPFQIEAALAYGGELSGEELAEVLRFANRVPLQYQAAACAISKSVLSVDWKNYGLEQARGAPPTGPIVIAVHIASAWVPFTSESKEAIAHYPEIIKEIRLALQDCGRDLSRHISARRRAAEEFKKRSYIEKYIPHIGIALREILELKETEEKKIVQTLRDTLERSRAKAAVSASEAAQIEKQIEEETEEKPAARAAS